ncbi:MAG: FliH/SctL family protein [Candidatus Gastranaerophilaceae bacterium]
MTSRIKGTNVQIGEDFLVPLENSLKDEETRLKRMIILANEKKEQLINEGVEKSRALVEEAKQILEQARIESEKIVELAKNTAESEANDIREQARKEGYEDGKNQGYQDGTASLEEKFKAIDTFAKCQFDLKHNIIKSAELDIIDLVIGIARKVCKKTLEDDIEVLKNITIDAINKLKDKESVTITINPNLANVIYSISDDLKNAIPKLNNIKIIEDSNVSDDGTIVETPLSRVDCRLITQIDQIAEKFMSAHYQKEENAIDNDLTKNFEGENLELVDDSQSELIESSVQADEDMSDDDSI